MYRNLCAAVCVLSSILIHTSIGKSDDLADMKQVTRLEKVWNDAYVRADADALDHRCADDQVVTMLRIAFWSPHLGKYSRLIVNSDWLILRRFNKLNSIVGDLSVASS